MIENYSDETTDEVTGYHDNEKIVAAKVNVP